VERQPKLEVEAQAYPELLLKPLLICRNSAESVLIKGSVNSMRVSTKVKQADQADEEIASTFLRFLMQRAESIGIERKEPMDG
jgi:actin related protein 2/3 complex subunit 4